jgi:phosphohistidine swiveling domain-containing protein
LEHQLPDAYRQLVQAKESLEACFGDVCDIEFTIENGRLFILNARVAKRSGRANLRFALQFFSEGKIDTTEVLRRVRLTDIEDVVRPEIENKASLRLLGRGCPTCEGAATGEVVFDAPEAIRLTRQGRPVIFVKEEVNPEDMEAMRVSLGVLTARGGMTSHAALVCRGWGKPGVVGFSQMRIRDGILLVADNEGRTLKLGDWITIDGSTGDVFGGRGEVTIQKWRDQSELMVLASVVDLALRSGDVPDEVIGRTWKMRDFFVHNAPLRQLATSKRAVPRRPYVSFARPDGQTLQRVRSNLELIRPEDAENYRQILLSFAESLLRQLSSAIGVGQHHLYFRPLWDPKEGILRRDEGKGAQLIGFEFFGINRYIPHLVDISTVTFLLEVELTGESDEWFLDITNPNGESLVISSDGLRAYLLLVNDACVAYEDTPVLYDSLRRREYFWQFYRANHTSYQEIVEFMAAWPSCDVASNALGPLCFELGLIRHGRRTPSGESLLGRLRRRHKYEFVRSQQQF